ncbi:MAG: TonB-dependent receptor, partial [Frankiaceae bacterium]|nr:TonB-dependent receptor [Arenimonas sp.]
MKSFRIFALLAGFGWALPSAIGQAWAATLPGVVVTATRSSEDPLLVPAAIDVIDGADIQRAQPRINLSESLQRVPGVVARDRQNYAQDLQISIRGFGARSTFGVRGVRLYSDGIPATMPDGQGQVSHFALDSAQRIEVLRGPFSALYGNSSGGVIALYSADAPADPALGFEWDAGSHGMQRSAASWRTRWGVDDAGSLLAGVSRLSVDGYRRHSAARRTNGQLTVKGVFADATRFTLQANTLDLQADDPQGLNAVELAGDRRAAAPGALTFNTRKSVSQQQLGAHLDYAASASSTASITAYAGRRQTQQMLSVPRAAQTRSALNGGGAIDLDRDYHGIDARWRWAGDISGQPVSLIAGIEYEVSAEHRLGFENFIGTALGVVGALRRDEDNRVTGQALYVQADWQPTDRWRVNAGLR